MSATFLAWHYTPGDQLEAILTEGCLRGSTALLCPGERPVVWFSINERFEPTAHKALITAEGDFRRMTWAEMRSMPGGLYRLGIPPRALLCGDRLRRAARIPAHMWRGLATAGRRQGADPTDWFGHVGGLPVDDLVIERLDQSGRWANWRPQLIAA